MLDADQVTLPNCCVCHEYVWNDSFKWPAVRPCGRNKDQSRLNEHIVVSCPIIALKFEAHYCQHQHNTDDFKKHGEERIRHAMLILHGKKNDMERI